MTLDDPPRAEHLEETESKVHARAEEQDKDTTATTVSKDVDYENNNSFSTDLRKWPSKLDEHLKEYWIAKGSQDCQNKRCEFTASKRHNKSENKTRLYQKSYFTRVHKLTNLK